VLAQAVADFLPREAFSVQQQIRELSHHGPFRRHDDGEDARARVPG
jgi:predicted N-acyltransferase